MLPKNKTPRELTAGLFSPEFIPVDAQLNDFVKEAYIPVATEVTKAKVKNIALTQTQPKSRNRIPVPLTEAEATEADKQIANTLMRIAALRAKIELTRTKLDEAITVNQGGKELGFQFDISKKPRLERAIKKLFGEKLDTVTHSMYKELLRAKADLENAEVEDYAAGRTKNKPHSEKQ